MKIWASVFLIATGMLMIPASSEAKMNCEDLSGDWSGRMSGKYTGATTMTLKANCRLRWKLPDGRVNSCRYKEKSDAIEYTCSLGSHGSVDIKGNRITMQNTYTAKKHGAYQVKFTKTQ